LRQISGARITSLKVYDRDIVMVGHTGYIFYVED